MGGSHWSEDFYKDRAAERARSATPTFAYTSAVAAKPASERKVHAKLDPKGVTREARDSATHPASVPVGFILDVTGSMKQVPVTVQRELPRLMDFLLDKGFVTDPQILFGAVGDHRSDKAPLQIGQFESGNEMEDDLTNVWLEGGGGGSNQESYELALYFFARHTSCDHIEKRGQKGYLFITGDEHPYPGIDPATALAVFGDTLQGHITTEEIVREVQEKFHVFFIIPSGTSHYGDAALVARWSQLLGADHVLQLGEPGAIVELVAAALAVGQGQKLGDALGAMKVAGTKDAAISSVALAFGQPAARQGVIRLLQPTDRRVSWLVFCSSPALDTATKARGRPSTPLLMSTGRSSWFVSTAGGRRPITSSFPTGGITPSPSSGRRRWRGPGRTCPASCWSTR